MYARLARITLPHRKREEVEQVIDEIAGTMKFLKGFQSATFFGDGTSGEYGAFSLWLTEEDAKAGEAPLRSKLEGALTQRNIAPADAGLTVKLYEVYEASIEKADYLERAEVNLRKASEEIERLSRRTMEFGADTRQQIIQSLDQVRQMRDRTGERLSELRSAQQSAWTDIRTAFETAGQQLTKGVESARSRFAHKHEPKQGDAS
jgi:heme-degrading monooxygenase HmoA